MATKLARYVVSYNVTYEGIMGVDAATEGMAIKEVKQKLAKELSKADKWAVGPAEKIVNSEKGVTQRRNKKDE